MAMGNVTSMAVAAAASSLSNFFTAGIKGAVDLAETTSKVQAIFGDAAGIIEARAEAMADKFGTVKTEFLDAASSFGASFKAAGATTEEAARIGNQLAKLGMDMASFGNASNAEVFTAMQAALRGEFDPLERFNVMLTAERVNLEAVALGLAKNKNSVDEMAKKQATLNLILKGTVDQQGDLERTADGTANAWRKLTGELQNLAVEIGAAIEPAINFAIHKMLEVVDFGKFVFRNFNAIVQVALLQGQEHWQRWQNAITASIATVIVWAEWMGRNWLKLVADMLNASMTAFQNFFDNVGGNIRTFWDRFFDPEAAGEFRWTPLLDGFKATIERIPDAVRPEVADMQSEIARILDSVAEAEGKLDAAKRESATLGGVGGILSGAAEQAEKKKADKFRSEIIDTGSFVDRLRSSIFSEKDDTARKQLDAQTKIVKNTADTAKALRTPQPARAG